ncbi:hypothetical protein ACLMJK_001973 [Lecanora helva]
MFLHFVTIPVITTLSTSVQASILELPAKNTTIAWSSSNSTAPLNSWPPAPFTVSIFNHPNDFIKFLWLTKPPHPVDDKAILGALQELGQTLARAGNPNDPVIFNQRVFKDVILDVRPFGSHPPITKALFSMILATVDRFFYGFGPVWFDSQIERGGKAVATFDLLF